MSKLLCSLCLLFLFSTTAFSQKIITTKGVPKPTVQRDTLSHWTKKNQIGFDISEIAFLNWNAGGTSSISGLIKSKFTRVYTKENYNWTNELVMRYGLNKQDGIELRKTEDAFQYNTAFGYRTDTISNWYYTAKLNFNTQFTEGYSYPNTSTAVSKLFAPAYLFVGIGAEYATKGAPVGSVVTRFTLALPCTRRAKATWAGVILKARHSAMTFVSGRRYLLSRVGLPRGGTKNEQLT